MLNGIWNLLQLLLGAFEMWICYRFLNLFFQKKYDDRIVKRTFSICILVTALLTHINRQMAGYSHSLILLLIVIIGMVANRVYSARKREIYAAVVLYFCTLTLLELFFVYSFGVLLRQPNFGIKVTRTIDTERIIVFFLARIVMFIIYIWMEKKEEMHTLFCPENGKGIYRILFLEVAGVYLFQYIYGNNYTVLLVSGWYVFWLIIVFIMAGFIVYILYRKKQEEIYYANLNTELLQYNYDNIYESYINSGKIYHDMKNHLIILGQYIRQGQTEKALAYIESIKGPICYLDNNVWSGIKVVDFVLNYKRMEAEKEKIQVFYEVDLIENQDFLIQDSELCALLSNLLDNAIEASRFVTEEKREIHVSIRYLNHMLMMQVVNRIAELPIEENGKYVTKKKDKQKHGIGISSIQNVVSKYEGYVEFKHDEEQFCVDLTLFC